MLSFVGTPLLMRPNVFGKETLELMRTFENERVKQMARGEKVSFGAENFVIFGNTAYHYIYGIMTTDSDSLWSVNCERIVANMADCEQRKEVRQQVIVFSSPGGTTSSVFAFSDFMERKTKPVYAYINDQCESAAYYVACLCDGIYARNAMCEVGSVGVFCEFVDDTAAMEKAGYKVISIYPPESEYKNKGFRDALKGDFEEMIVESLTPWAQHFQETVRAHRPNLNERAKGILGGKVYYARTALQHGMIDGVCNITDIIKRK